jgi:protocatechuate 3,4-dioxygenase beta subunit
VEVRLGGAAVLEVRVRAGGAAPVEGAAVTALLTAEGGDGGAMLRGSTGPDGTIRFEGLAPGTVGVVSASRPGFAPAVLGGPRRGLQRDASTLADGAVLAIEVSLEPGAVLAGAVLLQPAGTPVPGARVTLHLPDLLLFEGSRTAVADSTGSYRFEGLPSGKGVVFAHAAGAATAGAVRGGIPPALFIGGEGDSTLAVAIAEGPAETRRDLPVVATGSVAGRVLGPGGIPVAGARVEVRGSSGFDGPLSAPSDLPPSPVRTAEDGTFRVDGVPPADGLVASAGREGRVPGTSEPFALAAGAVVEGIEIRLTEGGTLLGRVTGPDGSPVSGAEVSADRRAGRRGVGVDLDSDRETLSDAQGNWRIAVFPAGQASLEIRAEGFVRRTLEGIAVEDGGETRADASLEAGSEIGGTVRDASGAPAAGVRVSARNEDRRPPSGVRSASGTTGSDGTFRIRGLPPASWTLTTASPRHPPVTVPSVASGAPALEIRLPAPVSIRGRVLDSEGNGLAGVRVIAVAASGGEGRFEVLNLAPGTYRLEVRGSPGLATARLEGVEGGTVGVDVRLEKSLSIAGKVIGPGGDAAPGRGWVRARNPDGTQAAATRWEAGGAFRLTGLKEGTYTLEAQAQGGPTLRGTASAPGGAEGVEIRLRSP